MPPKPPLPEITHPPRDVMKVVWDSAAPHTPPPHVSALTPTPAPREAACPRESTAAVGCPMPKACRRCSLDFRSSDPAVCPPLAGTAADAIKIVIAGGFGVGKTTMVRSVSEIRPLSTEETMTQAGVGIDDVGGVRGKTSTTVAFDFGRISLNEQMVLYLFGAPGQARFWFLWDSLFAGTLGAVVLVDTRRLDDSCDPR